MNCNFTVGMIKTNSKSISIEVAKLPPFKIGFVKTYIFLFLYTIKIKNLSGETVQLKSRYWNIITDGNGNVEEIRGPGVVGKQPFIKNGDTFEYTSYCPLPTDFGVMHGYFDMINDNGKKF